MDIDGQDVDDGARLLSCAHVGDCPLHEEKGRAGIDAVKPVPQGRGGGNHGPPVGDAGRIHQRVDAAEFFDRRVCNDVARAILGKIRRNEMSARPQRLDLGGDGFSTGSVAPAKNNRLRLLPRRLKRDGAAHALRGAGDDKHSAG